MPELVIPPGFAQLVLRWRIAGDPEEMVSTIGAALDGAITDPNVIAGNIITAWQSAWPVGSYSSQATMVGASAYIGQDGGPPLPGEFLVNTVGTSSSQMLPQNCCLLISKLTGLAGRRNKGRMYIPSCYMAEAQVDNIGVIAGGALTSLQSQATAFLAAIPTQPAFNDAVLFHSEAPTAPTVITALSVQTRIATQRERLRK